MTRLYTLVFLLISVVGSSNAATVELAPYVYTGVFYHDNLFLVADQQRATGVLDNTKKSDYIFEISPGIRAQLEHLRQQIVVDISLLHREFDRFDTLNFDGGDARLQWNWLYGRNWDGLASYRFTNKQSNFTEQLSRQGDETDIDNFNITANRLLTPRYKLLSGFNYKSTDYKRRRLLSRDDREYELGLRYTSQADNTVDLVFQNTDGEYPNRNPEDISRGLDNGYTENTLLTRVNWQATYKSRFEFELGYIDREQDTITEDDFDGVIGRINYHWALSGKSRIKSSIWRDLVDSEDQVSNFLEQTGVSIEYDWDITPKIDVLAKLSYEDNAYQSSRQLPNARRRDDEFVYSSIAVGYKIRRNVTLVTDYLYEKRDSNRPLRNYHSNIVGLSVKLDF